MRILAPLAVLALSACISGGNGPLPKLVNDPGQPVLALFEHVLTAHFAGVGASEPATCAKLEPGSLTAAQEKALIDRFARLSPASQCGEGDATVRVYSFTCASEVLCGGWTTRPSVPAVRYAMRFVDGAWRFDGDMRILAE